MKMLAHKLTLVALGLAFHATAHENVLFLVDVSGSMAALLPNIATTLREQVVSPLRQQSGQGLISFSGCGRGFVNYLVPLAKNNGQQMKEGAGKLRPDGATDIVAPLEVARETILKQLHDTHECTNIILFTDNEDTCGNGNKHHDVLREIQSLCANYSVDFNVDVITSSVNEEVLLFLDGITDITGGKIYDAATVDEIAARIKTIVEGYKRKKVGTPMTSKATTPEKKVVADKPVQAVPRPQLKKQPARSGQDDKKEKKEGGP